MIRTCKRNASLWNSCGFGTRPSNLVHEFPRPERALRAPIMRSWAPPSTLHTSWYGVPSGLHGTKSCNLSTMRMAPAVVEGFSLITPRFTCKMIRCVEKVFKIDTERPQRHTLQEMAASRTDQSIDASKPIHRENSPVTQTTPEPTLLSWGGWPRKKFPPPLVTV